MGAFKEKQFNYIIKITKIICLLLNVICETSAKLSLVLSIM